MIHRSLARYTRLGVLGSFAAALCAAPLPAAADDTAEATPPQVQYRKATEAYQAKNYEEARRLLVALWARAPSYDVAITLAQVENKLGKRGAMVPYLEFAIANAPPAESEQVVEQLKKDLAELKSRLAAIAVTVNQPGAEVFVNGARAGVSPLPAPVYVEPGMHTVRIRYGAESAQNTISVAAGGSQSVTFDVVGGSAPATPAAAPSGSRSQPAKVTDAPASSSEATGKDYTLPIVFGAVSLAGIGTGVVFLVLAGNNDSDKDEILNQFPEPNACASGTPHVEECREVDDLASTARTQRALAFTGFGIGAAAAAAAVTLLVLPSGEPAGGEQKSGLAPDAPRVTFVPRFTPDQRGVVLHGTF